MAITLRMRVRVFDTRVFPVRWPDGYAMLMSPNKGDTAVHGCHCPSDMVVGKCAPVQLIGIVKKIKIQKNILQLQFLLRLKCFFKI